MRILIATFGSLGDLFPYLNIAKHLTASGHSVTFATNDLHRERIESQGHRFHAIRPHLVFDPVAFDRVFSEFDGGRYLLRKLMFPALRDSYDDLKSALRNHDLMLSHVLIFAAPLLARETGIPWVSSVLAPLSFFSQYDPPITALPLKSWPRPVLRVFNKLAQRSTRNWSAPFHRLRRELGQPDCGNPLFEGQHSPTAVLALFSKHFAAPQPDFPQQALLTGFCFDEPAPLPPAVERFLASGPPPIVFTLGSSAVASPGKFFEVARELGLRAILLTGANSIPSTPDLLAIDYVPHSAVFPHAAAIVHQAGIGTASEVLRSGRPSLAVPFAFDQPDNAARLERLKVARVLSRRAVTILNLRRELQDFTRNTGICRVGKVPGPKNSRRRRRKYGRKFSPTGRRQTVWNTHPHGGNLGQVELNQEAELLRKAQAGSAEARDQLYSTYFAQSKSIQGLLTREVPIVEDREDILHDAYLSLIRSKGEFRGDSKLQTFVYRVVQIAILQKLRSDRSRRRDKMVRLTFEIDGEERERSLPIEDMQYETVDATMAAEKLLKVLPEPLRTAFRLRVTDEMSYDEIARQTGAPINTVATRIFKARGILARVFGGPALPTEPVPITAKKSVRPGNQ